MTANSPFTRRLAIALVAGFLSGCGGSNDAEKQDDKASSSPNKVPFGIIDRPADGSTLTGQVHVAGWALSPAGIKDVALYVDGSLVTSGPVNSERPDVAQAFPQIPNGQHSGWNIMLDTSTLSPGQHRVVARAVDNSGSTSDIGSISVTVTR